MKFTAALNVTTYNNPKALELCLESLVHQSCSDFSLFISDDGSGPETKALIDRYRPRFQMGIQHEWHEDKGYQKAKINNQTFRKISPDRFQVTLCIDHDVICHRDFVSDHLSMHECFSKESMGRFLFMGRRIDLGKELTASLKVSDIGVFQNGVSSKLLWSYLKGDTKGLFRAVRVTRPFWIQLLKRDRVPDLLGSNFSITTKLLHEVNGYNEEFQAYWGEDGDLFVRVRNSGALIRGRKSFAVQYHLDHPRLEPKQEYQERYESLLKDTSYVRCKKGISTL